MNTRKWIIIDNSKHDFNEFVRTIANNYKFWKLYSMYVYICIYVFTTYIPMYLFLFIKNVINYRTFVNEKYIIIYFMLVSLFMYIYSKTILSKRDFL